MKTVENHAKVKAVLCWLLRMTLKTGMVKNAKATKLIIGKTTSKISTISKPCLK
jgi:hypothetical protein